MSIFRRVLFAIFTGLPLAPSAFAHDVQGPHRHEAHDAIGMPASTMEIEDHSTVKFSHDKKWFVGANLSKDVAFKGANGFGLSVGKIWDRIYMDFSATYYSAAYGAIRVYQRGVVRYDSPLAEGSEIGRPRDDSDPGSIYTLGPGVGYVFRLLGSDRFLEMGHAGLNYAQYTDQKRNLVFRGGVVNFQGALGYKMGSTIIAPGLSWNLGYVQKVNGPGGRPSGIENNNYLPMQWWAFQMNLYLWMF